MRSLLGSALDADLLGTCRKATRSPNMERSFGDWSLHGSGCCDLPPLAAFLIQARLESTILDATDIVMNTAGQSIGTIQWYQL